MRRTTSAAALLFTFCGVAASQAQIAPAPPNYVGVIPQTAECPPGSSMITIHMDDEDTNNANARAGWIGAIVSDRNTTFRFCRVEGSQFKPLSYANALDHHYAVLRLSDHCPAGATEFSRGFHNQAPFIGRNTNSISSSSGNDDDFGPNRCSSYYRATALYFCLFEQGTQGNIPPLNVPIMDAFPDLGIHYGVFAAPGFSRAVQSGWVFTDDEDKNPRNDDWFDGDADGQRMVKPTNRDGRNTTLYTARVTPETRPVARCTVDPASAVDAVEATFADNGSFARGGRALVSYAWTFTDGYGTAYGPGPHYRYFSGAGSYTGTLTVTDDHGETATTYCSVHVRADQPCGGASRCPPEEPAR
jgi:hypothetical protein